MKTLPNGLTVFNATPHPIRFWCADWNESVEVASDEAVNARPTEASAAKHIVNAPGVQFVSTKFVGTPEGEQIIQQALEDGADIVVGSIIAAQAYPGRVCAMTPAPGYEHVPPTEKRMNPDKFTVF